MKEKVLEICTEVNGYIDFTSTNLVDDGAIDSLTLIEIVTELMEEFGIEIPFEEIVPENFNSIDDMVGLVQKYID